MGRRWDAEDDDVCGPDEVRCTGCGERVQRSAARPVRRLYEKGAWAWRPSRLVPASTARSGWSRLWGWTEFPVYACARCALHIVPIGWDG